MKFISCFPSVNSRLGDIGFTDERSGGWQRILNITDEESCRSAGVQPLKLSRARQHYITQTKYGHSQDPFVKIPEGWKSDVLGDASLENSEWDGISVIGDHKLRGSRPQQGIEFQRIAETIYQNSRAFIAGPPIFTRRLHIPETVILEWLHVNSSKLMGTIDRSRRLMGSTRKSPQVCIALEEYFTETWTVIELDGKSDLPIAIGLDLSGNRSARWDVLRLTRPTLRPRLGIGNCMDHSEYVIGCDGVLVKPTAWKNRFQANLRRFLRRQSQSGSSEIGPLQPPEIDLLVDFQT